MKFLAVLSKAKHCLENLKIPNNVYNPKRFLRPHIEEENQLDLDDFCYQQNGQPYNPDHAIIDILHDRFCNRIINSRGASIF